MPVVPGDAAIERVDNVAGLAQAVALTRIAEHYRFHADVLQTNVELLGLGDWHVIVVFAVNEHGGGFNAIDITDCRPFPQLVHHAALVREGAELDRKIVVIADRSHSLSITPPLCGKEPNSTAR